MSRWDPGTARPGAVGASGRADFGRAASDQSCDVGGLSAPLTLLDVELHAFAFVEGSKAVAFDGGKVNENVLLVLRRDESIAFRIAEPLDRATRHRWSSLWPWNTNEARSHGLGCRRRSPEVKQDSVQVPVTFSPAGGHPRVIGAAGASRHADRESPLTRTCILDRGDLTPGSRRMPHETHAMALPDGRGPGVRERRRHRSRSQRVLRVALHRELPGRGLHIRADRALPRRASLSGGLRGARPVRMSRARPACPFPRVDRTAS